MAKNVDNFAVKRTADTELDYMLNSQNAILTSSKYSDNFSTNINPAPAASSEESELDFDSPRTDRSMESVAIVKANDIQPDPVGDANSNTFKSLETDRGISKKKRNKFKKSQSMDADISDSKSQKKKSLKKQMTVSYDSHDSQSRAQPSTSHLGFHNANYADTTDNTLYSKEIPSIPPLQPAHDIITCKKTVGEEGVARLRKRRGKRVDNCFKCMKRTVTFLFSHIGLCTIVTVYTLAGGFLFQALEKEHDEKLINDNNNQMNIAQKKFQKDLHKLESDIENKVKELANIELYNFYLKVYQFHSKSTQILNHKIDNILSRTKIKIDNKVLSTSSLNREPNNSDTKIVENSLCNGSLCSSQTDNSTLKVLEEINSDLKTLQTTLHEYISRENNFVEMTQFRSAAMGKVDKIKSDIVNNGSFVESTRLYKSSVCDTCSAGNRSETLWTFPGSLLFSVTVITTIGYGHIFPRTTSGQCMTIVYGMIGIPIMLLCLAHLGGFMADAFRICYKHSCLRLSRYQKKQSKIRQRKKTAEALQKEQMLVSSVFSNTPTSPTEANAPDTAETIFKLEANLLTIENENDSIKYKFIDQHENSEEEKIDIRNPNSSSDIIIKNFSDLDNNISSDNEFKEDEIVEIKDEADIDSEVLITDDKVDVSMSRSRVSFKTPEEASQPPANKATTIHRHTRPSKKRPPSRIFMSIPSPHTVLLKAVKENSKDVHVPIWLSLLALVFYIVFGAFVFSYWEDWGFFKAAYFCFITLSTIGFGDLVPGTKDDQWDEHWKPVICSLFLLFGLSTISMSFQLMQEEVTNKMRKFGEKIGLLEKERIDYYV